MSDNKIISAHPLNRQTPIIFIVLILLFTILNIVPNVMSVHLSLTSISQILPNMIVIPIFIYFLAINLAILWKNETITLYNTGIEYSTRHSKQFWHWYEIDDLRSYGRGLSRTAQLSLHKSQKELLKIDDRFHSSATLASNVLQYLYEHVNYQVSFDAGDTISAGDIHVNRKGIQIKQDLLSWGEIRAIRRDQFRVIQIDRQNNESLTLNIKDIPNAPLLIQFITNHIQKLVANDNPESLSVKPDLVLDAGLNRQGIGMRLVQSVVGLLFTVALLVNMIQTMSLEEDGVSIAIAICVIVITFLLVYICRLLLRLWRNDSLTVNDEGIQHRWRGGTSNWKWEQFTRADVDNGYIFWIGNERVLTIGNHYLRHSDLGVAALDKVANNLYLKYKDAFDSGEMLNFGSIQISSSVIRFNEKEFAWEDISRASELLNGGGFEYSLFDANQELLAKVPMFKVENFNTAIKFIDGKLSQFGMDDPQI